MKSKTRRRGRTVDEICHRWRFIACAVWSPRPTNVRKSSRATLVSTIGTRAPNAKLWIAPTVYWPSPLNDRRVASSDGSVPAVVGHHFPSDGVQTSGPDVVAQRIPGPRDLTRRRGGQRLERGELLEPLLVLRLHPVDLGLLQHDFRHQYAIGVARAPPREVSPVAVVPGQQTPAEAATLGRRRAAGASRSARRGTSNGLCQN